MLEGRGFKVDQEFLLAFAPERFMPFYPGPSHGGIPIDPFYSSWNAKQSGFECRFIELGGQMNGSIPGDVRESPALDGVELLTRRGATDPWVPSIDVSGHQLTTVPFDDALTKPIDCAVVTIDHSVFDCNRIAPCLLSWTPGTR
jgi:UDP-N-acetyl-D-glucosamine dehydrogenase